MPRKKEKKVRIRVARAGRAPRQVSSGKKPSSKQIVNVYVTPSGTYATPIRSASVLESPMPIPQQPIQPFQPVFPTQQMQQQSQYPFTIGAEPVSRQEAEPVPKSSSQQFLERLNLQRAIEESQKSEPQIAEPLITSRSKQYIERKRDQFERQKKEIIVPTKK